jgi:hypothetical protein
MGVVMITELHVDVEFSSTILACENMITELYVSVAFSFTVFACKI